MILKKYDSTNPITEEQKQNFTAFLHTHLDRFGDSAKAISTCIDYVFNLGGFIQTGEIDGALVSVAVINETGMKGYIPEYILVYIATDSKKRGKGLGSKMLQEIINTCDGDIAMHVEPDNPAIKLYRRFGFTNKYLEMRRVKKEG